MERNEPIIKAAESVRDAVTLAECPRDTDNDGDCGTRCLCKSIREARDPEPVDHQPLTDYDVTADYQRRHGGSWADISRHLWGD